MTRSRGWCFTLNNYQKGNRHSQAVELCETADYAVFGYEEAPKTGTPHLQGYLYFKDKRTLRQLYKLCPKAKFMRANGTKKQNRRYCMKLDTAHPNEAVVEFGAPLHDDSKSKGDRVADMIREGSTYKEISEVYPGYALLHRRNIMESIRERDSTPRDMIIITCDQAGVHEYIDEGETVIEGVDCYNGEDVLIINAIYRRGVDLTTSPPRFGPWRVRRGYEIITINPKKLIYYKTSNKKDVIRSIDEEEDSEL